MTEYYKKTSGISILYTNDDTVIFINFPGEKCFLIKFKNSYYSSFNLNLSIIGNIKVSSDESMIHCL